MSLSNFSLNKVPVQLPIIIEKDEVGGYVVECPILQGCYTQGATIDEALKNIREVIELVAEEPFNKSVLESHKSTELSFHTITV